MDLISVLIRPEAPQRPSEYYTQLLGEPGWGEGGYTGWQIGSGGITEGPRSGEGQERRAGPRDLEHRGPT